MLTRCSGGPKRGWTRGPSWLTLLFVSLVLIVLCSWRKAGFPGAVLGKGLGAGGAGPAACANAT
eukprot:15469162-Alexandrium_andersonii.AAC.1